MERTHPLVSGKPEDDLPRESTRPPPSSASARQAPPRLMDLFSFQHQKAPVHDALPRANQFPAFPSQFIQKAFRYIARREDAVLELTHGSPLLSPYRLTHRSGLTFS